MATTITGLSEAKIDDVIVGSIKAALPLFDAFSVQLKHEKGLVKGEKYLVPLVGDVTVGDKTPGTLVDPSGSLTGVEVEVSEFKGASFEVKEGEMSRELLGAWWEEQIKTTAHAVAKIVVNAALGLVKAANYGNTSADKVVEAYADIDEDTLVEIRSAAKEKLKDIPGAFICNSRVASRLIKMQTPVLVLGMVQGKNPYTDGEIPGQFLGYRAFEYIDMPDNSENLAAAVIGKPAIAVTAGAPSQLIQSGDGDVRYRRIIEEPGSGLSMQYTEVVQGGGKIIVELGVLYGVKKAKNAVIRLVTA